MTIARTLDTKSGPGAASLFERLKEAVRQDVRQCGRNAGDRFFTLRELAERHNASTVTLNKVVASLQEEGVLVARRGSGIFIDRAITVPKTGCLALVMHSLVSAGHPYWEQFVTAVEEESKAFHHELGLFRIERGRPIAQSSDFVRRLVEGQVASGLILAMPQIGREDYEWLLNRGVAVVLIGTFSDPSVWCSHYANEDSIRDMYDFLIGLGHRRILSYSANHQAFSDVREQDILDTTWRTPVWHIHRRIHERLGKDGQIDADPALFRLLDDTREGVVEEICRWYHQVRPTAMFLYEEQVAWRVVEALRREGVRIPEDVSVMSKGSELAPQELTIWLTPVARMGRAAARLIRCQIQGDHDVPRQEYAHLSLRRGQTVKVCDAGRD